MTKLYRILLDNKLSRFSGKPTFRVDKEKKRQLMGVLGIDFVYSHYCLTVTDLETGGDLADRAHYLLGLRIPGCDTLRYLNLKKKEKWLLVFCFGLFR